MRARKLIEDASFGPDTLDALLRAFDAAWAVLAPRYGDDAPAIDAARTRLANILLGLAREDGCEASALRDAALQPYQAAAEDR